MLYFTTNADKNEVVGISSKFDAAATSRHDLKSFVQAESLAREAGAYALTLRSGQPYAGCDFIAVDNGPYCSPRFDVVRAFRVGDPVSYGFNGDSYECGRVVSVTGRIVTALDDRGNKRRFFRRKLSASFVESGTWSLSYGHRNERNPHL